jgi:hypothetical protein
MQKRSMPARRYVGRKFKSLHVQACFDVIKGLRMTWCADELGKVEEQGGLLWAKRAER